MKKNVKKKQDSITIDDINQLCAEMGWSFYDRDKFKLAWDLLKLARLDEDILIHYFNELL